MLPLLITKMVVTQDVDVVIVAQDAIVFPDALEVEEGDNDEGDYVFVGGDVAGDNLIVL
jgi:hypothetical protein